MSTNNTLELTLESLQTELSGYADKPEQCLFEYVWNAFDAEAKKVEINYTLPPSGIGNIKDICIKDDGNGWDFKNHIDTKRFLSSSKNKMNKNKSLPRGKYCRGRYSFIWIAEYLEIFSKNQKLKLEQNIEVNPIADDTAPKKGTKLFIKNPNEKFANLLFNKELLSRELILEFCWLLKENSNYSIYINDKKLDFATNIEKEENFNSKIFDNDIQRELGDDFNINIVLWKQKPSEFSYFYFIDEKNDEINIQTTGMNKKSDDFWHSVYIKSNFFKDSINHESEADDPLLNFDKNNKQKIKRTILNAIKQKLIDIRKPYLVTKSIDIVAELKKENDFPNLQKFGIYDEKSYEDLIKIIYTISPHLFVRKNPEDRKFICMTFAGLLSTQDGTLIKTILEQLGDLTDDEKADLLDILQRTSLSNMVKTIKEIDHRLQVIDDLNKLLFDFENETLEVKHLQQILNNEFWIFGEEFRLFSNTEGSLKNVLIKFAKEILNIDDSVIDTKSRKEVDLFLTKTQIESEDCTRNIIVEIKRPNVTLGKKQYDQIEQYCLDIIKESVCNSTNMSWEFYLIGNDYDDYIAKTKIEQAKNFGEIKKGLTAEYNNGRVKIYVRKWSDILNVEWKYKMLTLKNTLQIKSKDSNFQNPDEMTQQYTSEKN